MLGHIRQTENMAAGRRASGPGYWWQIQADTTSLEVTLACVSVAPCLSGKTTRNAHTADVLSDHSMRVRTSKRASQMHASLLSRSYASSLVHKQSRANAFAHARSRWRCQEMLSSDAPEELCDPVCCVCVIDGPAPASRRFLSTRPNPAHVVKLTQLTRLACAWAFGLRRVPDRSR